LDEVIKITSGSLSGIQLLMDFTEAEVGSDGLWLTTASWQSLLSYIFTGIDADVQVSKIFLYVFLVLFFYFLTLILVCLLVATFHIWCKIFIFMRSLKFFYHLC
jgi:hypothetical protein